LWRIDIGQRRAGRRLWNAAVGQHLGMDPADFAAGVQLRDLAGLVHELGVDRLGHGRIEAQEAARCEAGHLS